MAAGSKWGQEISQGAQTLIPSSTRGGLKALEPSSRDKISAGGVVTLEGLSEGNFPPAWDGYIERLVDAIPGTYASVKSQIKALIDAERQGEPGQSAARLVQRASCQKCEFRFSYALLALCDLMCLDPKPSWMWSCCLPFQFHGLQLACISGEC